ncbi:beta-lactamase/transpeptidase-like protein [Podospora conica]|nr:beta-lactamase/transpeptidase-like protein [Schizothecium conicum]
MNTAAADLGSDFFSDTVNHLCSRYGNVGLSTGVLEGSQMTEHSFGTSDGDGSPTSKDTIFLISSMTKPIIALAVAIMAVDETYAVDLTTEVKHVFPQLASRTFLRHANRELTVADLLDNRTEFMRFTNLWESPNGDIPWKTAQPILSLLGHLPLNDKYRNSKDFVHARNYSNEGFALAAAVLEEITNMPWAEFVRQQILQPLGMTNTFAGLTADEERRVSDQMAKSFSVSVERPLADLQKIRNKVGSWGFNYRRVHRYVRSELSDVESLAIPPSQAPRATSELKASPLGAAAGIMSTVSDLLVFYQKFIHVYHLPKHRKSGLGQPTLSKLERGMLLVQSHIKHMMEDSTGTCAYAAGWSTALLPWNGEQASPKPRWPGADGDNAKRLDKVTQELNVDDTLWPFFLQDDSFKQDPRLVLSHGGNMIGATSFCMVDLEKRRAVVVLSNTRGYLVDVANFVGLLMSSSGEPLFRDQCDWVQELGDHVAASYLWDMHRYEESLRESFPRLADPGGFGGCIGRFQLVDEVFATTPPEPCLVLQLYGSGHAYPLRVARGADNDGTGVKVKMTFASSMRELLPTGVGGTNRLTVDDFVVTFRRRDQGQFQELVWVFDRGGGRSADPSAFAFKRVVHSTNAVGESSV